MSIRWRRTGELICGAMSRPEEGDTYINDRLHHQLHQVAHVILPDIDHESNGLWHWVSDGPFKITPIL